MLIAVPVATAPASASHVTHFALAQGHYLVVTSTGEVYTTPLPADPANPPWTLIGSVPGDAFDVWGGANSAVWTIWYTSNRKLWHVTATPTAITGTPTRVGMAEVCSEARIVRWYTLVEERCSMPPSTAITMVLDDGTICLSSVPGLGDPFLVGQPGHGPTSVPAPPHGSTTLGLAHPNPFKPSTRIPFVLESPGQVSLRIYSVAGELVRQLVHEYSNAGEYAVTWDGCNDRGQPMPSGVYYCRLAVDDRVIQARTAVMLK